jgi:hypothetical protein
MKLLLNCDHVFEVLTRGPFPTGEPTDDAVEQHLAACHECRQLAEALRPAVALFHEAVSKEESLELPEYQGILPEPDPFENDFRPVDPELRSLGRLFEQRPARRANTRGAKAPPASHPAAWDVTPLIKAARLVAAAVLIVSLGWLAWGLTVSPRYPGMAGAVPGKSGVSGVAAASRSALLDHEGYLSLVALKLPESCLPPEMRAGWSTRLAAADALRCCTECHRAGGPQSGVASLAHFNQACSACHRG